MNKAIILVDLGFGDQSKGATTDFLTRHESADLVVLTNGGAQRAHNVVLPDGTHHTFSQFGSGTFAGARTHISEHFLLNPESLNAEWRTLSRKPGAEDVRHRLTIHEDAAIITPFHVAANRARENHREYQRHGSCGVGIGETAKDVENGCALRMRDLRDLSEDELYIKLKRIMDRKFGECEDDGVLIDYDGESGDNRPLLDSTILEYLVYTYRDFVGGVQIVDRLPECEVAIFEPGQGILLDRDWGFFPHVTRSVCTSKPAMDLIRKNRAAGDSPPEITTLGLTRAYQTRHGAGPMPTEHTPYRSEVHNGNDQWQGAWRDGPLDGPLLRYAIDVQERVAELDGIAVSHLDQVKNDFKWCYGYTLDGEFLPRIPERGYRGSSAYLCTPDLAYQQYLTRMLERVKPRYKYSADPLDEIYRIARREILVAADGPTYVDRQWLD